MSARRGSWLIVLLLLAGVLASAAGLVFLSAVFGAGVSVRPGSVLVLRLRGDLAEVEPGGVLRPLLAGRPTVRSVIETLQKAQADSRILGLVVIPNETPALWAKVQELRGAIEEFRRAGKPTVAYLEYGGDQEYYLATACEHVFLLPSATLDLDGLASYEIFLRGTLDRLGIYPDLLQVGDYKTAVNIWTERGFTEAHREMAESLNRDTFAQLVRGIAEARGKTEDDVRALIDAGPFLAEDAMREGLVDDVAYEDQIDDKVHFADGAVTTIEANDYARVSARALGLNRGPRIAVVYAVGTIDAGESREAPEGPVLGSESLIATIRSVRSDESVRAIVLRIDSPGGSSVASDIIWRELALTRAQKPLIVSMSDVAASGGYYVALPAHHIVAQPGTLTGSIGVYGGKIVVAEGLARLGGRSEEVASGAHAGMRSALRPYTPTERAKVERQLTAFYDQFVERVAEARGSTPERVDAIAQGRVWTGRQALELGLVDEVGGLDRAVARAKQRAGIPLDSEVELVLYPPSRSLYELVASPFDLLPFDPRPLPAVHAWLPPWLPAGTRQALLQAALPWRLFRGGEPLALMPYVVVR